MTDASRGPDAHVHERRRRSFEHTAERYDRYRPHYPVELFDEIKAYADLAPDDAILEVGAGTGRATVHLARWGNPVLAIEPAPAMADIARSTVVEHSNVEVRTVSFEQSDVGSNVFGLVVVAQAFHWLDPNTRIARIQDALYAYGTVALVWNNQYVVDETRSFFVDRVQQVYLEHAPDLAHEGRFDTRETLPPPHPLDGIEGFTDLRYAEREWSWALGSEDYIGLMSTHSGHAALEPGVRSRLHDAIAALIDEEFGGSVTEHYVATAALAKRA